MPGAAAAAMLAFALATAGPLAAGAATPASSPTPTARLAAPAPAPTTARSDTPASAGAHDACPDFEFIGARGSGEDNQYSDATRYTAKNPTFGMGAEVHDVFQRLDEAARRSGLTITPYGVPYPAVGIDAIGGETLATGDLSGYTKSVELGAHAATAELERVSRACPDTGVIVGGYSQGAQTMVDAVLAATPSARASVVAAVFFGNTYFDASASADDDGSYDPDLDGYLVHSGLLPAAAIGPNGPVGTDWAKAFGSAPVFDYCHDGDPICGLVDERTVGGRQYPVRDFAHIVAVNSNGAQNPNILTQHTDYLGADTANAAQQLKSALSLPLGATATATQAAFTSSGSRTVGAPVTLNAGGSLSDPADPIVSYRWTIDAGTAAQRSATTSGARYTTTFAAPGTHQVRLTITTASGATSTSSAAVTAVAAPLSAPRRPAHVAATAGDAAAALTWPGIPGADFYAVTDGTGRLLTAFTTLVPGQTTVSWTDTGLTNGRAATYRVYAVNSAGRSKPSAPVTVTPRAAAQRPVAPPVTLPVPNTALIDPELVWSLGLGLIVVMVAIALIKEPQRPRQHRLR